MHQISEARAGNLNPAQAAELSLLVDLEALWENLRKPATQPGGLTLKDLSAKQKAYDAFRSSLAAYNKKYAPAHVSDLLLNTPTRLGIWCRTMRNLYLQIEPDPRGHCPVHLLEKAYRWADQIAARRNLDLFSRTPLPATITDAIKDLDAVAQWCDDLLGVANPGPQPAALDGVR
jgi:hypothetical protein